MKHHEKLTKNFLHEKYVIEQLSAKKISELAGCGRSTVLRNLEKHNINRRTASKSHSLNSDSILTKEFLYQKYIVEKLSLDAIAELTNLSIGTVFRHSVKHGIQRRSSGEHRKGKPLTLEHRRKLSEGKKGQKSPLFGKKSKNTHRCWYTCPDGKTVSMRSTWEVWYAEYLRENNVEFQYEPTTFILGDGSAYTPDFYLPLIDEYIEIKGWFTAKYKNKIDKFKEKYPRLKLTIADKHYLKSLGIDLRRKWIATRPKFQCAFCRKEFYREQPRQIFCSLQCNGARRRGRPRNEHYLTN